MEIPESNLLLWESPVSLKGSHPFPVWTPPRQPVLLLESWLLRYASPPILLLPLLILLLGPTYAEGQA